jgi:L-lactate dehydrogenase complex protein LldG
MEEAQGVAIMSEARDAVFASIRRSLGVKGDERIRRSIVEDRLARAPTGVVPARGQLDAPGQLALFQARAEGVKSQVHRVATPAEIPEKLAEILRQDNLPAAVKMGDDPRLAAMPWGKTSLNVSTGPSDGSDLVALSHAEAGIAETGTLALVSGVENPTTLNFLPDHHFVVLAASDLVGDFEALWPRIRKKYSKGEMPRTLNYITGPSRSGDIEQTLLLGAHGPRQLHIFLVQSA